MCDFKIFKYFFYFKDGTEPVVKDVLPGDSVHSLLSILDVITVSSLFSSICASNYFLASVFFLPSDLSVS